MLVLCFVFAFRTNESKRRVRCDDTHVRHFQLLVYTCLLCFFRPLSRASPSTRKADFMYEHRIDCDFSLQRASLQTLNSPSRNSVQSPLGMLNSDHVHQAFAARNPNIIKYCSCTMRSHQVVARTSRRHAYGVVVRNCKAVFATNQMSSSNVILPGDAQFDPILTEVSELLESALIAL